MCVLDTVCFLSTSYKQILYLFYSTLQILLQIIELSRFMRIELNTSSNGSSVCVVFVRLGEK